MTTTLLAERSAVETKLREARADRAKVAAADRNDPRLPQLRQAIIDLEGQLEDLDLASEQVEASEETERARRELDERRNAQKAFAREARLQVEAVERMEAAADALARAFHDHRESARRARVLLHRHCTDRASSDLLDTLILDLPTKEVAATLCRAGLAPYIANPTTGSPEPLAQTIRARLDRSLPRVAELLNLTS